MLGLGSWANAHTPPWVILPLTHLTPCSTPTNGHPTHASLYRAPHVVLTGWRAAAAAAASLLVVLAALEARAQARSPHFVFVCSV